MNTRNESDEWLMGQVQSGNRESLESLVRRYAGPLMTFIERMVGDRHRSEELFQEVFLAIWSKRKQYKRNRPFRSWLYTIAANRCRADFRRQPMRTASPIDVETAPAADNSPLQTAIATETAAIVETAVAELPSRQRIVVVLRVYGSMSYGEIAEVTGTSEGTVRSNMHRGLAAMKKYLEPRLA